MKFLKPALLGLLLAGITSVALAQNEQFIPMLSYRVGPYAAGGSGIFGGYIDYLNLINLRDGGINGVKLAWEECETEYNNARGVECYERLKKKSTGATLVMPLSTGITYALIEKATADKIPLVTIGYGRTDASDGRVFPYVFPLITNYWSQNTAKIKFIGMKEGGMDKLKGKKIVNLYHDSAYGKETIPIYELLAQKYGFTVQQVEVPHPGNEQQSQWLTIRRAKPDYVVLRGWGVMNPVAPADRQRIPGGDRRMALLPLITFDAAFDLVLGLALFPGQFDAIDAAVADVDEIEIVDEAAEEPGAAGGVRTDSVALQGEILFIGERGRRGRG